ncbi:MAG: hypothetical protein IJF12_01800 [Alphaproteobacteria bacterium]|nr:hypothetical protein [Alphaproteobacteria bacterium]
MHGVLFESVLDYNNKGFDALEEQIKQVASAKVDKAQKVQEKLDSEIQKIKSEYAQQTQNLQTQIKNIYEQLDELNVELNDAKLKYNEAKDDQIQADSQANAEGVILDLAEKRSEKSENVDTSNFEASANQAKQEAENAAVKAEQRRKETLAEVESLRMQIDDLKDRLEKTKNQLKQTKSAYIEAVALKEYENEIELNKAYEEIKNVKASKIGSLLNLTGTIKDSIFRDIIFVSERAEEIVRENALSAIREAYAAIEALEDDRFNPEKYSKIVNIHKQMLDKIKNPSFGLSGHLNYLSGHIELAVIEQLAIEEMAKVLFNKICKSNVCYQSDEQYYIGATPNEKDFVAPKAITKSYTPPLREIVHFDGTDYDNLDISNNSVITKDSLLNVGAMLSTSCEGDAKDYFCQDGDTAQTIVYKEFVPEIWSLILGPKGFVERDVPILPLIENLSHPILFEDMAAKDQLMRGGLYPCSVGEYAIDIKNGQYVGTQNDEYPKCQHIKNVKKYSKLTIENGGLKNVTFLDLTFGEDEVVTAKFNTSNDEDKSASELALFAKSQDKMMRFNKSLEKAAQYLAELDDDYDKNQKRLYDNMMLDKNQFGDYLKFVERELEFQKSLDQLKVKVDEAREKLREEFAKYGYTLPDEFDLSDDETYKDFAAKLNEAKDERVSKADTKLLSLVGKNDMLKERIAKTKNTMSLLKLDNDELINLSDMLSLDEVEKRIKTAKADNDTKGEYDKEVAKSYDNNSKGETIPYCAVY